MLIIRNTNTDPYFNLAAEEYLLKAFDDDIFRLWRNENAIIVGKHQNTLAEINIDHVRDNNVRVVRRLSGGGAVFHDLGNLNFTFIRNGRKDEDTKIDFRQFTQPIIDVLKTLDIHAEFSGRNDLLIDGQKFSGNAEHVYHQKKRTLHHGTLLFASVINDLSAALKVNPLKFEDKAVKSVRSRVTNISSHLKQPLTVEEFYVLVENYIRNLYPEAQVYEFTGDDIREINALRDSKYITWEWNFGYSPNYRFQKLIRSNGGSIEIHMEMEVERGSIAAVKFFGDFFNIKDKEEIEQALVGCKHEESAIRDILRGFDINSYFNQATEDELVGGMF